MLQTTARVIARRLEGAFLELELESPELAQRLQPGQPILVSASWGIDPYLRRTFYPVGIGDETFLLRIPPGRDRGHAWMRTLTAGMEVDCLGPVGQGFGLKPGVRHLLCLGEGEWAWSLLSFVQQAVALPATVTFAVDATSARNAIPAQRLPLAVEYRLATIDGSRGRKGRLSDILPDLLLWADAVAAAGSLEFYRRLADAIIQQRVLLSPGFAQALFPSSFLCGTGACQACAVDIAGGRRRVCLRGPVFDLADVMR